MRKGVRVRVETSSQRPPTCLQKNRARMRLTAFQAQGRGELVSESQTDSVGSRHARMPWAEEEAAPTV